MRANRRFALRSFRLDNRSTFLLVAAPLRVAIGDAFGVAIGDALFTAGALSPRTVPERAHAGPPVVGVYSYRFVVAICVHFRFFLRKH